MSHELGTEARALLARARHSSDPSASDRWAVRRAVATRIARVGAASAALAASVTTTKASASFAGGLKVTLLSQFGLATVAGATLASSAMFVHTTVIRTHANPPAVMVQAPRPNSTLLSSPAAMLGSASVPAIPTGDATADFRQEDGSSDADITIQANGESAGIVPRTFGRSVTTGRADPMRSRSAASQIRLAPDQQQPAVISAPAALREEGRALAEVQHALSEHRGADALGLLDLQSKSFEGGALVQERAAARIFALCELGRRGDARVAANRFAQTWPDSPLLGRVLVTCK